MNLALEDLVVAYRQPDGSERPVLVVPQFRLAAGEQLCLFGGSGSGKTTLLHVISGIVLPTKGRVFHGEVDIADLHEAARDRFRAAHIGYVFQTFNLLQGLSARENVALAGTLGGLGRQAARERASELLARVGLAHREHARPGQLSVGEQQRTAIARAVINRPTLLLADEPTANLDPEHGHKVIDLLQEVAREAQATLLLVTHEPDIRARFSAQRSLKDFAA